MVQGTAVFGSGLCLVLLRRCLQVVRQTNFANQFLLGFEPIDVFFVGVFCFSNKSRLT